MHILTEFTKPYRGRVAAMFGLLLLQALGMLFIPTLMAEIVDKGILAGDLAHIWRTSGVMLLCAAATAGISVAHIRLSSDNAARIGRDLRNAVFRKTQAFSLTGFERFGTASLITRCTNDVTQVQTAFSTIVELLLPAPFMMAAGLILTFSKDRVLAFTVVAVMAVVLFLALLLSKKAIPLFDSLLRLMDEMNRSVLEKLTGVRVIRAFHRIDDEKARLDETFAGYAKKGIQINRLFALLMPLITLIMNLCTLLIVGIGERRIHSGGMPLGDLYAVMEYATIILTYLMMGLSAVVTIPRLNISARRIREVLDAPAAQGAPQDTEAASPAGLEFRNVSFGYGEKLVLSGVSFSLSPGKTTAVIGSTGSGKSTLLALIMRFFDPQEGAILAGGRDVRELPEGPYLAEIGYVPQRAFLFSGTIAGNLRHGKEDASEEEMLAALRIAQMEDFISSLEDGLDARVAQGGSNFSGGQRQRLAIARAVVRKPQLYLFDDSFSALDFKTDAKLRAALRLETKDAAVLIVAQRIGTIQDADEILVLDEGRIVGRGTHRELMESCPVYRQIADSQMRREATA